MNGRDRLWWNNERHCPWRRYRLRFPSFYRNWDRQERTGPLLLEEASIRVSPTGSIDRAGPHISQRSGAAACVCALVHDAWLPEVRKEKKTKGIPQPKPLTQSCDRLRIRNQLVPLRVSSCASRGSCCPFLGALLPPLGRGGIALQSHLGDLLMWQPRQEPAMGAGEAGQPHFGSFLLFRPWSCAGWEF